MGPGVDPHLHKASQGDITRMASADLRSYSGLHLEGRMTEVRWRVAACERWRLRPASIAASC